MNADKQENKPRYNDLARRLVYSYNPHSSAVEILPKAQTHYIRPGSHNAMTGNAIDDDDRGHLRQVGLSDEDIFDLSETVTFLTCRIGWHRRPT